MRRHAGNMTATSLLSCSLLMTIGCGMQPLGTGSTMPALRVAGWTNGDPPAADELAGSVLVLEVFATW